MGKRKERKLSRELGRFAAVAGTTAAVAQTVATAADRVDDIAELASDAAVQVVDAGRSSKKWILLVAILGVVGLVVVIRSRRSTSTSALPYADIAAGSAAPVDVAVTTSA